MKKILTPIFLSIFIFSSCETEKKIDDKKKYLRWVGDIEQNNELDNANFKTCNGDEKILQYFNLGEGPQYIRGKSETLNTFKTQYKPITDNSQSGFIRIRFIVNCEGKAGRFRILQSDYDYQEVEFDVRIVTQLMDLTKEIQNWKIFYRNEIPIDYYFYIIFKISNGQLTEILP